MGVHYVGEVGSGLFRTLFEQLTDGQLEWAKLDDAYDVMSVGYGADRRCDGRNCTSSEWSHRQVCLYVQISAEISTIYCLFVLCSAGKVKGIGFYWYSFFGPLLHPTPFQDNIQWQPVTKNGRR